MTTATITTKHCRKCNENKPTTDWSPSGSYCKDCTRAYNRAYHANRKAQAQTSQQATNTRHRPQIAPQRPRITPGSLAHAAGPAPHPKAHPKGSDMIAPAMSEFELDFIDDYWDWKDAQIGQHLGRAPHQITLARTHHFN